MSGTLASLIRQHQLNQKALYVAPESDRESAPGEYDRTGSQRSSYLDRLEEKQAARDAGDDAGLTPDELDDIEGWDDLKDILDDKKTDPTKGDPDETPTDPLGPDLPDPDEPGTDEPDVVTPAPIPGLRAYALHSHSISYTHDGGGHWSEYPSPGPAIGFAVTKEGVYVATTSGIHYSPNLDGWTELTLPDATKDLGLINGSFESGIDGWERMSGLKPSSTRLPDIVPTDGSKYLSRDWLFFTNSGAFEVGQDVTLSEDDLAQLGETYLSFSADVFCDGGSVEMRIDKYGESTFLTTDSDRILSSDPLSHLTIECDGLPAGDRTVLIDFVHNLSWSNVNYAKSRSDPTNTCYTSMRWRVRFGSPIVDPNFLSGWIVQSSVQVEDANILNGAFQRDVTFVLTSDDAPGTITIKVPTGWRFPINNYEPFGHGTSSHDNNMEPVAYGTGWTTIASASGSDFTWNRLSVDVYSLTSPQVRCVIKGMGSPADVCIDAARLELVGLPVSPHVTAISGEDGTAVAAINGKVYRLSPNGMTRIVNGWTIEPEGLQGASIGWEDSTIATSSGEISAPGSVREVLTGPAGLVVTTDGGEIYVRTGDTWDNPFGGPFDGRICYEPMRGIYLLFDSAGYLSVSRDGSGWENAWRLPGGYSGEFHACTAGRRVLIWAKGREMVWWLDSNACRLGGVAPAGIIDISAG